MSSLRVQPCLAVVGLLKLLTSCVACDEGDRELASRSQLSASEGDDLSASAFRATAASPTVSARVVEPAQSATLRPSAVAPPKPPSPPRYLADNPGCAVPAGYDAWSWKRLHRVEGLSQRAVILTLDVGAKVANLEKVLDVLAAEQVKTTIFLYTGELAASERGRAAVRRMVTDGHELANHTLSHKDLTKLSVQEVDEQLESVERFTHELTGGSTRPFFREPYLATNDEVDAIVRKKCFRSIWFTVDTADWKEGATADGIEDSVFRRKGKERTIESGSIFIFHGSQVANVEALPRVIARLREQGFAFLTLGQALQSAGAH